MYQYKLGPGIRGESKQFLRCRDAACDPLNVFGTYDLEPDRTVIGIRLDVEKFVCESDDLVPTGAHDEVRYSSFGVWRSLVARAVRVGEVPGSNPGTPTSIGRNPHGFGPGG